MFDLGSGGRGLGVLGVGVTGLHLGELHRGIHKPINQQLLNNLEKLLNKLAKSFQINYQKAPK